MALSPINQLRNLLDISGVATRGKVTKIFGGYMHIATDKRVIKVKHISGYRIGQYVLVDKDGKLTGKASGSSDVPVYIV